MDTRKVAAEYRLAQWAQIIQAKTQSGQSIKDFCSSAGISRNTYFYWQRKLRQAACAELSAKESEQENRLAPIGWSRLESVESPSAETAGLTIEISGCRVSATAETDPELLAKVCRMLKLL